MMVGCYGGDMTLKQRTKGKWAEWTSQPNGLDFPDMAHWDGLIAHTL